MIEKVGVFFVIALMIGAIMGWLMNIAALAKADVVTGFVLLRAAGVIVPPLGAVLGYF